MRKLLFSTAMLSFFTYANAQITIDSTDYATFGDTIFMANDTIPIDTGISVGGTGFQIWDFTNLLLNEFDTIIFIHPDSTLFGSGFPSSNLATEDTIISNYQTSSATQLTNDGFAGDPFGFGVTASAVFDPPQKILDFPSTFNDSFTDTIKYTAVIPVTLPPPAPAGLDSIKDIHESYISSDISAFGTVMLPGDTFNTIRQFYTEETIDSVFIYCSNPLGCFIFPFGWTFIPGGLVAQLPENPITDTTYTYSWWAKGVDFPVVEIETDNPAGNVLAARFKIGSAVIANIISTTDASCSYNCDGQAVVTGISGVSPYNFIWDDPANQTNDTATGLCPGTYIVTVIDAVPDTAYATVFIGPDTLTITATSTFNSCNSDTVKSITVSVTGGTSPYEYSLDSVNFQTSSTLSGLAAGNYDIYVRDANGCMDTIINVTITDPPALTGTIGSTDESSAGANDGTVWVNASGGTPSYTYLWMPGSLTGDSVIGLSPNTFTVTVTDANGCIFTGTDTVFAGPTGVKELFNAGNSKLYPNPTTGILNIEMPEVKDATIFVYNLLGKVVVEMDKLSEFASINLAKLTEGTYFIKIQTTDRVINKKLSLVR